MTLLSGDNRVKDNTRDIRKQNFLLFSHFFLLFFTRLSFSLRLFLFFCFAFLLLFLLHKDTFRVAQFKSWKIQVFPRTFPGIFFSFSFSDTDNKKILTNFCNRHGQKLKFYWRERKKKLNSREKLVRVVREMGELIRLRYQQTFLFTISRVCFCHLLKFFTFLWNGFPWKVLHWVYRWENRVGKVAGGQTRVRLHRDRWCFEDKAKYREGN